MKFIINYERGILKLKIIIFGKLSCNKCNFSMYILLFEYWILVEICLDVDN